jgi:hypothetical protein
LDSDLSHSPRQGTSASPQLCSSLLPSGFIDLTLSASPQPKAKRQKGVQYIYPHVSIMRNLAVCWEAGLYHPNHYWVIGIWGLAMGHYWGSPVKNMNARKTLAKASYKPLCMDLGSTGIWRNARFVYSWCHLSCLKRRCKPQILMELMMKNAINSIL